MKFRLITIFFLILTSYTLPKVLEFPKIKAFQQCKKIPSNPNLRLSSYPYISGDTFRSFCDFVIDKTNRFINPDEVKDGDTIFISAQTALLDFFFKNVHPKIKSTYILVTHNSDLSVFKTYSKYLDDDNIVAWLGQNLTLEHKKAFPIPIGLANRHWGHGNTNIINEAIKNLPTTKEILLYMNIGDTNHKKRRPVLNMFSKKSFCYNSQRKPFKNFIDDLANSKFALSPEGNGIDCHRTWESLYLGCIPIVTHSKIDSVFEDLPVIIIDNWSEITEEYLIEKYEEISQKSYNIEKIFADYWFAKISAFKQKAKRQKI